ncbi:alpha-mannosidase [Vagococcus zengguangii]|uniref:Alpha-mannosidase n=1 Tax=Vagococcus zengguangii TaxID=2571750 RepID=A0A4D7CTJ2_9ENTE|nr:alpha-mannosidase [Vagococcus zengguangii]QCI86192.1 alpha-mannosidase [Vagococcus zengguangii]
MFDLENSQKQFYQLNRLAVKDRLVLKKATITEENVQQDYQFGTFFGKKNHYYTIETCFTIPKDWSYDRCELFIYSDLSESDNSTNPQIKVYLNDHFVQAVDTNHHELLLDDAYIGVETSLRLEIFSGREEKQFPIHVECRRIDQAIRDLFYDVQVAWSSWKLVQADPELNLIYKKAIKSALKQVPLFDAYSEEFYLGIKAAKEILRQELYESEQLKHLGTVVGVGHTHIDLAWLWTVQQAIEKGERSYTTVMKLMDEYPDYTFFQSQPQMYQFIKNNYPELYELIKEKIAEGRWEIDGGMWVEADCNMTSGESLVRQILHGKKFIKDEFNKDSKILWLPDVFGYTAALPQLLKKSGIDYFMTTKLSWNQSNKIPYDSFYWKGIDGSEVLTHFITTVSEGYQPRPYYTTYNGMLDPYTVKGSWERYQQKDLNDEVLIAYGYGDGGGGPTRDMLETAKRLENGLPGIPKVKMGHALSYFDSLKQAMDQAEVVPKWMGELYFEYHRGTYTSIGKNKKANRQLETLLQSVEKYYAHLGEALPKETMTELWQLLLLNQFHDILPGSSIKEVYDQTDLDYEMIQNQAESLLSQTITTKGSDYFVFNPLAKKRDLKVKLPLPLGQRPVSETHQLKWQRIDENQVLVEIKEVASLAAVKMAVAPFEEEQLASTSEFVTKQLETPYYTVTFDEQYQIISLIDKQQRREILPAGKVLNELIAYEDIPMDYDAWDIDPYYKEKAWSVANVSNVELIEKGDVRQTLVITRQFKQSTITQAIHFYHDSARIDFETDLDWHQKQMLLKAQFPVEVNSLKATFDIQFGNVERDIHENTSWDKARFEVYGQKWVDISEGDYGVAVLSNAKYGFNVDYQNIGITLVKSAIDPYDGADQGHQHFIYSLMPHTGDWKQAPVMEEALDLNTPALVLNQVVVDGTHFASMEASFVTCELDNVLIDTIKPAEDGKGYIIRLYEFKNKRTEAALTFARELKTVQLCDLLENPIEDLVHTEHSVTVPLKPYEVQTLKIFF